MFATSCRSSPLWALLLPLAVAGPLAAASPRDELLRFVPEQAGFCLVVQNLRGHLSEVAASPLAQKWLKSERGMALAASREWKTIVEVDRAISRQLGIGWVGLRDDILGDAFAFAYQPGPPGKPEEEQGLFLVRARDAKALAALVQKINAWQKASGELKAVTEREHRGVKYHRREEAKANTFYHLRGPVLLFTAQEPLLRRAIACGLDGPAEGEPPVVKRLRELKLDRAVVALAVNPRAWDGEINARAADPAGKTFAECWKALQGIGLAVELGQDARVRLNVKAKMEQLPAPVRRLLSSASRASDTWAAFPADPLLAVGGRVDLPALYDSVSGFLPKAAQKEFAGHLERTLGALLGRNVVKDVLPAVGPDWGLYVAAPAGARRWMPNVLLAVRVARGDESDPLDEALMSGIQSWVQLAAVKHNVKHPDRMVSVKSQTSGGLRIRYLHGEGVFPAGVQPAFALKDGYLLLGGSPGELRSFKADGAANGDGVPLARVSVKAWRSYLADHREALAGVMAGKPGVTREQALGQLDDLRRNLTWIERVELRQSGEAGFVSVTLTVQPAVALKK